MLHLAKSGPLSMDIDPDYRQLKFSSNTESNNESPQTQVLEFQRMHKNNEFRLRGVKNDDTSVALALLIADSLGRVRNIHFLFYLDSDTTFSVASEMVAQLDLGDHDVAFIAEFIDYLIMKLLPGWKPSFEYSSSELMSFYSGSPILGNGKTSMPSPWDSMLTTSNPSNYGVEQDVVSGHISNPSQDSILEPGNSLLDNTRTAISYSLYDQDSEQLFLDNTRTAIDSSPSLANSVDQDSKPSDPSSKEAAVMRYRTKEFVS